MNVAAGKNKGHRVVSFNSLRLYALLDKEKKTFTQLCEFSGKLTLTLKCYAETCLNMYTPIC